jgi:hypothetical protein
LPRTFDLNPASESPQALEGANRTIPHGGLVVACNDCGVAGVVWIVKEGKPDDFDGPVIMSGYVAQHPVREPSLGDVLQLTDASGAWRVVDWKLTNRSASAGNVLVVEAVEEPPAKSQRSGR